MTFSNIKKTSRESRRNTTRTHNNTSHRDSRDAYRWFVEMNIMNIFCRWVNFPLSVKNDQLDSLRISS